MTTMEKTLAALIVADENHRARVAAWEANDCQHPDHYKFKMAFRDAILLAADACCEDCDMPKVLDKDLPELFRSIDSLAERLWLRRLGFAP